MRRRKPTPLLPISSREDIEQVRVALMARWRVGIDRNMLREYRVLYYALGRVLRQVGEI